MNAPSPWLPPLLLTSFVSRVTASTFDGRDSISNSIWQFVRPVNISHAVVEYVRQYYPQTLRGNFSVGEMVQLTALCSLVPSIWYWRMRQREGKSFSLSSTEGPSHDTPVEAGAEESNGSCCYPIIHHVFLTYFQMPS
jgi:hypothetical protein